MAVAPKILTHRIDGVEITITCEPISGTLTEITRTLNLAMTAHIQDRAKLAKDIAKQAHHTREATP